MVNKYSARVKVNFAWSQEVHCVKISKPLIQIKVSWSVLDEDVSRIDSMSTMVKNYSCKTMQTCKEKTGNPVRPRKKLIGIEVGPLKQNSYYYMEIKLIPVFDEIHQLHWYSRRYRQSIGVIHHAKYRDNI